MSLRVDNSKSRSRSKSPGRGHERSRSNVRAVSPSPQYQYTTTSSTEYVGVGAGAGAPQYAVRQPGQSQSQSQVRSGSGLAHVSPDQHPAYQQQPQTYHYPTAPADPRSSSSSIAYTQSGYGQPGVVQYAPTVVAYSQTQMPTAPPVRTPPQGAYQYATMPEGIKYTATPVGTTQPLSRTPSQQQQQPQYAMPQPAQFTAPVMPEAPSPQPRYAAPQSSQSPSPPDRNRSASVSNYGGRKVVEMVPGGANKSSPTPPSTLRPHSLSVSGGQGNSLAPRMDRLSVSGNRPDIQTIMPGGYQGGHAGGGLPPPSPLLEAYHGTYQSISPFPHAMVMDDDLDLPPLDDYDHEPRSSNTSLQVATRRRGHSTSGRSPSPMRRPKDKLAFEAYGRDRRDDRESRDKLALEAYGRDPRDDPEKKERRVKIYDAEDDALALSSALTGHPIETGTVIEILPALSHDQILELRNEYKRHCKVQGHGINIAKHIKVKITGTFGKIAYVTALGKYESEGYWANYWYQSGNAKRELLIEALMGRQNHEVEKIKDVFKDKRYGDSLTKCMNNELKADKFRKAVLMALQAQRQEESDVWAAEERSRDAETLYRAIKAREGGESAMLDVVLMRSDAHLRDVLRLYERRYQGNFARDALRKSNNLVGEVIAHILNGVINRPARDAMLLHHALMDLIELPSNTSRDNPRQSSSKLKDASSKHERQQRYELLISRLVRLHWERMHLSRVKLEYEEKYGRVVEEDVEEATKGDLREFCMMLCQTGK